MTIAIPVYGGTVKWNTTTTTYNAILKAKTLILPEEARDYIDVTNLDSPDGRREWMPGLIDAGELTLSCIYTPTVYGAAKGYADGKALVYFETQLVMAEGQTTTGDKFEWSGYVVPSVPSEPVEGAVMLNLEVRTSGALTYTAGS